MNLVFYIYEDVLLRELDPMIWIGDTSANDVRANVTIDVYDYFHSPRSQISMRSLDSHLLDQAWQWFLPFADQSKRWGLRSKYSLETLSDWFIREVAEQTYFLMAHKIRALHFAEDPHRGRDFLACKLAEVLEIPVYIYETVNIGYRTFVKTAIDKTMDTGLLVPEAIRGSQKREIDLSVDIRHTGVIPEALTARAERLRLRQDSSASPHRIRNAFSKFLVRRRAWLRKQYIVPRFKSELGRLFSVLFFFSLARFRRIHHIIWWRRVVESVNVEAEDIVFYAHYWPERTTNPRGSPFFSSQIVCLEILIQTGRKVYFQEHPVSLSSKNQHQNRTAQGPSYRRALKELKIPIIRPAARGNHIVATMSGTAGLESALKGLKVICFARPWYRFLPNVHVFTSWVGLQSFLNAVPTWTPSSLRKEMREHLERHSLDARPDSKYLPNSAEGVADLGKWIRFQADARLGNGRLRES